MLNLIILIRAIILLKLVSGRTLFGDTMSVLPASRSQVLNVAKSVCYNVEWYLEIQSIESCAKRFLDPEKLLRRQKSPQIRCQWKDSVTFEVSPLDLWQLFVLIPDDMKDNDILLYSLIKPNQTFGGVGIAENKTYTVISTVLNKEGRPALWRKDIRVEKWISPDHRPYDVQTDFSYNNDTNKGYVTGHFQWNRTGDMDACFDFYNNCEDSGEKDIRIRTNSQPSTKIDKLLVNDKCTLTIKGMYGTTTFDYFTLINQDRDGKPEIPKNITIEAIKEGGGWSVRVTWAEPHDPPDRYNVTVRTDRETTLLLDGNATEAVFHDVAGEGLYNISIWAIKGHYAAHNSRRAIFPGRSQWRWASAVGGAWGAVSLCILGVALCWLRLRKRIYSAKKTQNNDGKSIEDSCLESLGVESWCEDGWEVKSERLMLHEVIGEGAFGVVRRGILAPTGKEVAVKMLKDFPSLDEIRSFRLEMELMKSVGAHPHVVSLVGCCSGKRPLIVAEYCSRGDLLSFLRCSWDVMISKRNAKYYNNNIDSSEYRNDLFKCKAQREQTKLVVNKLYDLQGICDSELTSLDLLSFCRQIAKGMEFLASNRLVHRDLAARNVLVTSDRTLKIADFGLSRDVYEENQYKQKGNGKMPVKWMALESLTRRIYTTQSDVWSFGVVVWEIVTVGGAPYAGVPAARLPRLLRAGYRMPRPTNCSKQLYELMLSCWRAQPRARPTFATLHKRLDELLNCACADDYLSLELDDAPPTPKPQRYFKMILRAKRNWTRGENYERPLKAPQSNHYTSSPMTFTRTPV